MHSAGCADTYLSWGSSNTKRKPEQCVTHACGGRIKSAVALLFMLISLQVGAQVHDLRVEGMSRPLGIESLRPAFSWQNQLTHNGQRQSAYEIEVSTDSAALQRGAADLWRSGRVESEQQVMVPYGGKKLEDRQVCYWRVRTWNEKGEATEWSETARFAVGPLSGLTAKYIGCKLETGMATTPMFRRSFRCSGGRLMMLHVNSLGYHEIYINGKRVGDKVLQPAVSQLNRRSLTVTYDITPYVQRGRNEILIWVGQGWGRVYGTEALVQAEVCELVDGRWHTLLQTDRRWQTTESSYSYTGSWQPLQFGGECLDARRKPRWQRAEEMDVSGIKCSPQQYEGNVIVDTLKPQNPTELADGTTLLDFGRVITGWLDIRFKPMPQNGKATMEYADHRAPGDLFAPQGESDCYISDGKAEPTFCNKFHYHAFRYVRITGAKVERAVALQFSALKPTEGARFACSDERLNAIHDLVKYTLSCLTYSGYMVDCPHLERMGYGGDGNSSTPTLQTLYNVAPTYYNWLTSWEDAVAEDGELAYVAPDFRTGGGPYWSGFIIKAPWRTYLNYGDSRMIGRLYGPMKRWLSYLKGHEEKGLLQPWPDNERHTWFLGDWLAPEGVDVQGESAIHVSNCFLCECLGDMASMARMLGHGEEAAQFELQQARLREAIHARFYHPQTHSYAIGTPLDLAYALRVGVPPDSATFKEVRNRLIDISVGKHHEHMAVGLVGVPIFTQWAIDERQAELMATLLRQPDYPGYLNMIAQGATTTWESWNGERSHVHNCYNGIGIWFYQALAGIRPDPNAPGYKHFFIDPQAVGDIRWVKASKPTPYGTIEVDIEGEELSVTIPAGTTATFFPGTKDEKTLPAGKHTVKFSR